MLVKPKKGEAIESTWVHQNATIGMEYYRTAKDVNDMSQWYIKDITPQTRVDYKQGILNFIFIDFFFFFFKNFF